MSGTEKRVGRATLRRLVTFARFWRSDAIVTLALAIASLVFYLRTLAPGVVDADGGELQFAAWNFSFVHPTGYPLFLILGGLTQHLLAVGDPAYRLNVFTAFTAALAVGMLYLAVKELTCRRSSAAIAALSFAVTRTFWFDASAAEVYDLNAFFLALLLFLALRWQASASARAFGAFCFVFGLALTHHRTMILWAPAFALFFVKVGLQLRRSKDFRGLRELEGLRTSSRPNWRTLRVTLLAVGLFLLPFLMYLYIPLRAPSSPYAVLSLAPNRALVLYDNTVSGFLNYVFGRAFQHEIGWDATSIARLGRLPQWSLEQFSVFGIGLGLVGLGCMLARKAWARLTLLMAGAVTTVLFASLYHIGDIAHYYIPAFLIWAVWIGVGLAWLGSLRDRRKTPSGDEGRRTVDGRPTTDDRQPLTADRRQSVFTVLIFAAIAVAVLAPQFVGNFAAADRSHETQAREQWDRILAGPIPPNAILLSNDRDEMMPLWYIQYVENRRLDLLGLFPLITPLPEHANIVQLIEAVLDTQRPLYLIKPMPGLEVKFRLANAVAPMVRVEGRVTDAPPRFATDAVLGDRVRVIGYDVARQAHSLQVAVYWQPFDKLEYNYTTFVHLVDERGQKIAQGTDHQAGGEFYPTTMWQPGEALRDGQSIVLPPGVALKEYRLVVGMYRQREMQALGEPLEIGTVDLR